MKSKKYMQVGVTVAASLLILIPLLYFTLFVQCGNLFYGCERIELTVPLLEGENGLISITFGSYYVGEVISFYCDKLRYLTENESYFILVVNIEEARIMAFHRFDFPNDVPSCVVQWTAETWSDGGHIAYYGISGLQENCIDNSFFCGSYFELYDYVKFNLRFADL